MTRPVNPLSDRRLKALLKGLKQDVAAPPDFRARVLRRLAEEGLVAAPARPAAPAGLRAWFSPARLGLGLAAAASLALVLLALPSLRTPAVPSAAPAAPMAAAVASKPAVKAPPAALAAAKAPASKPVAAAAEQASQGPLQAEAAPALGRAVEPTAVPGLQIASVEPVSKPTVVYVETPAAPIKALRGESEVRNNVIRASRGDSAVILFKVSEPGRVRVEVRDRLGRLVAVLRDEDYGIGEQSVRWSGAADAGGMAASGIYQVGILGGGLDARHKVMLVK